MISLVPSALRKALPLLIAGALLAPPLAVRTAANAAIRSHNDPRTLILYDTSGEWGYLGELYATATANLSSHFGSYVAKPVADYRAGQSNAFSAVIYVGSTWNEPIPTSFLDDVLRGNRRVLWLGRNIWQLEERAGDFASNYGWAPGFLDNSDVLKVRYKGVELMRAPENTRDIMGYSYLDEGRVDVLAEAVRPDGTTFPWAVRSENLTYVGENPFPYIGENDRYLIFTDLLFDLLAPSTPERHRALVRLEDVGPDSDPDELRDIARFLYSRRIPFSFGVYPVYKDPLGVEHDGRNTTIRLKDEPEVVSALKYMQSRGGVMIMHGYTHQYRDLPNPYDGRSREDFEFFRAHVSPDDHVVYDGPVAEDSFGWALGRIRASAYEFWAARLSVPKIFEFPHYAGSAPDYQAVDSQFNTRYERSLYFAGVLEGAPVDHSKMMGQFFPYVVTDVYGTKVIPENLGNIELEPINHHPARLPADIIQSARRNLVVRDGFASFFFHWDLDVDLLRETVDGIRGLGYRFVSPVGL